MCYNFLNEKDKLAGYLVLLLEQLQISFLPPAHPLRGFVGLDCMVGPTGFEPATPTPPV